MGKERKDRKLRSKWRAKALGSEKLQFPVLVPQSEKCHPDRRPGLRFKSCCWLVSFLGVACLLACGGHRGIMCLSDGWMLLHTARLVAGAPQIVSRFLTSFAKLRGKVVREEAPRENEVLQSG